MGDPRGFMKHERSTPQLQPVAERITHHREHYEEFPLERVATQASRCMDCGVPFCMTGCPLGNLIPEWNDLLFKGRIDDAVAVLHQTNNFPEFTGRVCPGLCENSCVLGITDPQVAIKLDEQTVIDQAFKRGLIVPIPPSERSGKTVAVVGGGPAGLACAQQLNRAGHTVEVFEKNDRAGGLVMYGIPHYKLDKRIVQRRIDLLQAEGIVFHYNMALGRDLGYSDLAQRFDAVVLAIGAERPRDLPVDGRELDGIHFAMEYLPQSNRANWGDDEVAALHPRKHAINAAGKAVIVIGGGDTGSDCIGTALRQGARSVQNFELLPRKPDARNSENPWPQYAQIYRQSSSVEELEASGAEVQYSIMTKRFTGENGRITGVETVRIAWEGRSFEEIPGTEETWEADLVLLALGFTGPDPAVLDDCGVERDDRGNVATDPLTRMSSVPGLFACGDCRRGQSLVVWGIAEGREVARNVDTWLMDRPSHLPAARLEAFAY
ncbi:MAG: glutamate synthase subunit beta [Planctomycetota bacterium]